MPATTTTTSPTALFFADAIERSGKTQREIAQELGFSKPNFVSMMKTGETRVPIDRIPALAAACGADERQFLVTALMEYHPELWRTLLRLFPAIISEGAREWLVIWQIWLEDTELPMDDALRADAIAALNAAERRHRPGSGRS